MQHKNKYQYTLTIIKEGIKTGFAKQKIYSSRIFSWLIADLLQFGTMTVLLVAAIKDRADFTQQEIILYFLLVIVFTRIGYDFSHEYVTKDILSGDFSKHVIRPGGYLAFQLGDSIGTRLFRILSITPVLFIMIFFAYFNEIQLFESWMHAVYLVLSLIIAFGISFTLSNLFTMSAFFVKQIYGLKALYNNLVMILSGEFIPIAFMPIGLASVIIYLPYRYMLYFPIQIMLGWIKGNELLINLGFAIAWLLFLSILLSVVYKKSVMKFEGEGL